PGARITGAKELFCAEFLPALLERGGYAAIILRDPRDILVSLNHGRGQEFGGAERPTLAVLRQWRQSVAFAIELEPRPRFLSIRYEDLVTTPAGCLTRIAKRFGVEPFTTDFREVIPDRNGGRWTGNSSHGARDGVSAASVGLYRTALDPDLVAYVEAVCYAELRALGYDVSLPADCVVPTIARYRDPHGEARPEQRAFFTHPARVPEEVARYEILQGDDPIPAGYFPFPGVAGRLREVLREG